MYNNNFPDAVDDELYDVAIVGYGPTGAVLASLLAKSHLRVLLLEREDDILELPRAIRFDGECMRLFQTIGIHERLSEQTAAAPGMKFLNARGELLIEWERPLITGLHGWSDCYRVHQPDLERILRENLRDRPGLTVCLSHELCALEEHENHVTLRYENRRNGQRLCGRARYVVGCDGARSMIRRLIGSPLDDLNLHQRWVVVDLLLKQPMPHLGEYSIQYCDPKRPATYICGAGERRRWELMLMPEDDPVSVTTPEWIWSQLARWITPDEGRIERSAIYTFHAVIAQRWRKNRLFIAGDAAHQTPPFMGQGMAAGLRDAANLAWKLQAVLNDEAPDTLLETYASERIPHVKTFVEGAVRFGEIIQAHRANEKGGKHAIERYRTPEPLPGPGAYDAQPVPVTGRLAPQFISACGRRLDEIVGYRYLLLCLSGSKPSRVDAGVECIVADDGPAREWLNAFGACAALIRPDRYLFGVATLPEDITPLLGRAFKAFRPS